MSAHRLPDDLAKAGLAEVGATWGNPKLGGIVLARGTTVPTDAATGYAKGCLFIDTNAEAGSILFLNVGTIDSCDFNVIPMS